MIKTCKTCAKEFKTYYKLQKYCGHNCYRGNSNYVNPFTGKVLNRRAQGVTGFNHLYGRYKVKALQRNYSFELTKEEFRGIVTGNCVYCGVAPFQKQGVSYKPKHSDGIEHVKFIYNGIDRLNNSMGYAVSNCVPCCKHCNRAKDTRTVEEFKQWVAAVHSHWVNK